MLREEIVRNTDMLVDLFKSSGAYETARAPGRSNGSDVSSRIDAAMIVYGELSNAYVSMDDSAKRLVEIFSLEPLFESNYWTQNAIQPEEPGLRSVAYNLSNFLRFAQPYNELLSRDGPADTTASSNTVDDSIITIYLLEDYSGTSKVERITKSLNSVQSLYNFVAEVNDIEDRDLAVVSCDSGSDKSFDLLGTAECVKQLRKFIVQIIDRLMFRKEMKMTMQADAIAKSSHFFELLLDIKDAGTIDNETFQRLSNSYINSTSDFISSGTFIDDSVIKRNVDHRRLIKPEQKLLSAPDQVAPPPQSGTELDSGHVPDEGISHDDAQKIIRLADQLRSRAASSDEAKPSDKEDMDL